LKRAVFVIAIRWSKKVCGPGLQYPRVPGHEIAGRIDVLGDNVTAWQEGQRVGCRVAWRALFCVQQCRRRWILPCAFNRKVTGFDSTVDYAEYMIAPAAAVAGFPRNCRGKCWAVLCARAVTRLQRAAKFGGEARALGM